MPTVRSSPVRSRWGVLVAVLIGAVFAVAGGGDTPAGAQTADEQTADEQRLREARDRLAELSDEIDAASRRAETADEELADADEQLAAVEQVVNDVAAAVDRQRLALGEVRARLAAVEAEAATVQASLDDRVTRLFKQGPMLPFEALFAGGGPGDAMARSTYLRNLTDADRASLESLDAVTVRVDAERARVATEQQRLDTMLAEQRSILDEVEALRASRALAAADARDRLEQLEEEQDDLEADQERIERLIRERQEQARRDEARRQEEARRRGAAAAPPSGGGSSSGGSGTVSRAGYVWPMCAPVTSEYGPRWGRIHRGIDLGAPTGTPIGASKAGRVIFAGWQGGYGQLVLIDHGDGVVTAYAHMSRIGVGRGASVSQGQSIGAVGSTGNSTGPHLHLEMRVNGRAVNPRQYLSGRPC